MRKITRSFTFWFCIASLIIVCLSELIDIRIVFWTDLPVFYRLAFPGNIAFQWPAGIEHVWYALHFISYLIYGGIIDLIRYLIKRIRRKA